MIFTAPLTLLATEDPLVFEVGVPIKVPTDAPANTPLHPHKIRQDSRRGKEPLFTLLFCGCTNQRPLISCHTPLRNWSFTANKPHVTQDYQLKTYSAVVINIFSSASDLESARQRRGFPLPLRSYPSRYTLVPPSGLTTTTNISSSNPPQLLHTTRLELI
jgi:hypothetical protein